MTARMLAPAEWLRKKRIWLEFTSGPPGPNDWTPPLGTAALRFQPDVRQFAIVCIHGSFGASPDQYAAACAEFAVKHSECRIAWVRLETWPASRGAVAGFGVTGTADAETQDLLRGIHARAETAAVFAAEHPCKTCVPSLAETSPINDAAAVVLSAIHQFGCLERRRDGI